MPILNHLFRDHPDAAGESYFEHMRFASRFAGKLLLAGFAALAHAVVPALCESTASSVVLSLHDELVRRRANVASAGDHSRRLHRGA